MAMVILGGLVTSTLLNLFVVPVLDLRFGRGAVAAVGSGPPLDGSDGTRTRDLRRDRPAL